MQKFNLATAASSAGRNGVIARERWARGHVIVVRKFERSPLDTSKKMFNAIFLEITEDSFGNWHATQQDLDAQDWIIVARSIDSHAGARV